MDDSNRPSPYQSRTASSAWARPARQPSSPGAENNLQKQRTRQSSKGGSISQGPNTRAKWKSLFNFTTRKHVFVLVSSTLISFIVGGVTPAQSYLMGQVFGSFGKFASNVITEEKFKHDMFVSIMFFIGLGTICWIANSIFFAGWTLFGELQAQSAREKLFHALLGRRIEWFEQRKDGMGALTTKIHSLVLDLQNATSQPIGFVIRDLTTAIASLGLAFSQSWKLTFVIIATLPVTAVVVPYISTKIQPAIDAQIEVLSSAAKHVTNSLSVIETVKCYNGQGVENWRYASLLSAAEKHFFRQTNWGALQAAVLRVVTLGMFVQGFWYGTTLVEGSTDPDVAGSILTAFWSCVMGTGALMQVMPQLISLEKGKVAGQRLRMVMAATTTSSDSNGGGVDGGGDGGPGRGDGHAAPVALKGDIAFENVYFSYPSRPQQPVLQDVSMFFAAGDLTFIIGKSGSGKSTIGQLLMKFYRPSGGSITLDEAGIQTLDAQWLRSQLLLVEQTSVLFNTTLQENISLGSKIPDEVTMDDVEAATRFSEVHEPITKMPDGYQTKVGTKGGSLSGGQRQRVALARVKIRDPTILILDESTSALDYINRLAVMDSIRTWRQGKSTIIITHDISQIRSNDFVYVMRDGEVVQSGFRDAMEQDKASPFQDFVTTENRRASRRMSRKISVRGHQQQNKRQTLHEMVLPILAEDAVLDSGSESDDGDEDEKKKLEKLDFGFEKRDDPLDWYLDDPTPNPRNSMWMTTLYNPRSGVGGAGKRQSVQMPQVVAPFWSVMPGNMPANRMTNMIGSTFLGVPNIVVRKGSTAGTAIAEEEEDGVVSPIEEKRMSKRLSRSLSRRFSTGPPTRPRSLFPPPRKMSTAPLAGNGYQPQVAVPTPKVVEEGKAVDDDTEDVGPHCTVRQILKTVWPLLNAWQKAGLIVGFIATLLYAASTPLFAFVFSKLLACLYDPVDRKGKALRYSLAILGIAFGDAITIFLSNANCQSVAQCWVNALRRNALERILEQPREFFDGEGNEPSRLAETLDYHAEQTQLILGRFVGSVLIVIVMVLMAVVWSLASCWKLTLVLVATTPVLLFVTGGLSSVGAIMEALSVEAIEAASAIFSETFLSIKTVRTLTLEKHFETKHSTASSTALKIGVKKGVFVGMFYGLSQSILLYIIALIFYYGAVLLRTHAYDLKAIMEVFTLLLLSVTTATMILGSIPQLNTSQEAASRLLRLVELPEKSYEHEGGAQISEIEEIQTSNLEFRYPTRPENLVLKGVDLHIKPGSCVALVGISGSGKSTIAALLLKLYQSEAATTDSNAHDITISGRSIHQLSTPAVRNLVSIVSQTPTLFPTTISGNIVYGLRVTDPRNSAGNVKAAAISAGIHEFISSLPDGYDTLIGDGGMGLSGGQAQRIAIARALARRPDVLIMDEATSALDVESASVIRQTVQSLLFESRLPDSTKPLTVIIITHAREMMQIADQIIMLDQGKIAEEGSFDELMARDEGAFASLLRGEAWDRDVKKTKRRSMIMMSRASGVWNPLEGIEEH